MAFHTGSFFIASLGMFEILMSFPVSIFIYRLFFGVSYLGNIQILSIFVVLGVGADDVFVFYDAFKQSAYEPPRVSGTILGRVTYTAERASKAIFVTSFTTMMAFLATAMSKVMPISAFGILSATMIFVLFAVNVLFFPPALVLYHRYFSRCCACGPNMDKSRGSAAAADAISTVTVTSGKGVDGAPDAEAAVEEMDMNKLRPIEWFFRGPFFRFISSPARYVLVAGFLALLVVGVVLAAQLETPAEQEQWYPSEHMMQAFSNNRMRFMSSVGLCTLNQVDP
jgi:predicted RND superfamily exporter protein